MAQIFYVHCPACERRFPCHPELWQVSYDLLCPFCQNSFPQEQSPLIVTMTGEQRAGRASAAGKGESRSPTAATSDPAVAQTADQSEDAESM